LAKFDSFLGIGVFESIYAKSSNVFAAMPSLHAAYMLIVLYYSIKANLKSWNILFAVILVGIWFAAVYSGHHYVLDILAGVLCTVLGVTIFHCWSKSKSGKSTLKKLESITSR